MASESDSAGRRGEVGPIQRCHGPIDTGIGPMTTSRPGMRFTHRATKGIASEGHKVAGRDLSHPPRQRPVVGRACRAIMRRYALWWSWAWPSMKPEADHPVTASLGGSQTQPGRVISAPLLPDID